MAYLKSYGLRDALLEPLKVQNLSLWFDEAFTDKMLEMIHLEELEIETKEIPEWIVQFPKLRKISICESAFMEGKSFEILGEIPSLKEIELRFSINKYIKKQKYVVPNQIRFLKQIAKLTITEADTYPTVFDGLDALECLELKRCNLKIFPEGLQNLSKLEQIRIVGDVKVKTLPVSFCKMSKLKVLELYNCSITALPPEIGGLQELKQLTVTNEANEKLGMKKLPVELMNLTELEAITISGTLLAKLPSELCNLNKLTELRLPGNHITKFPKEILGLEQLKELNLNNNLVNEIPKEIASLTQLEILEISNTGISDIPEEIVHLAKLKKLNLSVNRLAIIPDFIGQLKALEVLNLNRNQISAIPEILAGLINLKEVGVSYNQLLEFPPCLFVMDKLEVIAMGNNGLSELPENLDTMKNLMSLNCAYNQIKQLPQSIKECQNLQKLDLSGNPLEEEDFFEIFLSMPWCSFQVSGTSVFEKVRSFEEERKLRAVLHKFTGWEQIKMEEPPVGMTTYWFGHRSEEPAPHRIGPEASEVFHEKMKLKKLIPFLTVDLHELRPDWQGRAHFLAWDYSLEYLTFQLKEDKYIFLEAGYPEVNSLTKLFQNLDDIEDLNPKDINWKEDKSSYFRGNYYAMEPFHLPIRKEEEKVSEWLSNARALLKNDPRRFFLFDRMPMSDGSEVMINLEEQMFLAPEPIWLQSDATPVDPDGKVMDFVGQINPSVISRNLPDGRVYMFYSQKYQIITLVGQCT